MHTSVLYNDVLTWLTPQKKGQYIDATLGFGGHTLGLLNESAPNGRVLSFDRDESAIKLARTRIETAGIDPQRLIIAHAPFGEMETIAPQHQFDSVDGIVFDLGVSSMQFDDGERGFSFRYDAPLDMRMDQSQGQTAADLINTLPQDALSDIFWQYGDEKESRKLARIIVAKRQVEPIMTTIELAELIAAHKWRKKQSKIHPATKVFQALRIAVNDELGELERGLSDALQLLKTGGRIAVISFHSLEDRYVKNLFRDLARDCICPQEQIVCVCDWEPVVTLPQRNKAIKPTAAEIADNPRSRSARLRIAERTQFDYSRARPFPPQ